MSPLPERAEEPNGKRWGDITAEQREALPVGTVVRNPWSDASAKGAPPGPPDPPDRRVKEADGRWRSLCARTALWCHTEQIPGHFVIVATRPRHSIFGHKVTRGSDAERLLDQYERAISEIDVATRKAQTIADMLRDADGYLGESR